MKDFEEGQYVYINGRPNPNKEGWFNANGVICEVQDVEGRTVQECEDEGEVFEPYEIYVKFDDEDTEWFFCDDFEWTDSYQGTWIKQ